MKKILLPCFCSLFFISCNEEQKDNTKKNTNTSLATPLKEMTIENDKDSLGGTVFLDIQQTKKISAEKTAYKVISLYKGSPVGFTIIVRTPAKKNLFVDRGVTFLALKDTSNNFLKALSEIYGIKFTGATFKDSITVTYADLTAEIDLTKPGNWVAAQKKLFFETYDDSPELFLNIDSTAGTLSFPEKDPDNREGIIRALSKKLK